MKHKVKTHTKSLVPRDHDTDRNDESWIVEAEGVVVFRMFDGASYIDACRPDVGIMDLRRIIETYLFVHE